MGLGAMLVALGLPCLAGAALLAALGLRWRKDPLGFMGAAFPAGALLTGLVLFGWLCTGASLVGGGPQIVVLLCTVGLASVAWRRRAARDALLSSRMGRPRPSSLSNRELYANTAACRWTR